MTSAVLVAVAFAAWLAIDHVRHKRRLIGELRGERLRMLKARVAHYSELAEICRTHGMPEIAERYERFAEQDEKAAGEMESAK